MQSRGWSSIRDNTAANIVRNHSRMQVWHALRAAGRPVALSDLVRQVDLSRATVSAITKEMLQVGLLQTLGVASSTGGRPPNLLHYRPDARLAAGVAVIDNEITAALTDLDGKPLQFCSSPWQGTDPFDLLTAMTSAVRRLIFGLEPRRILGVGVGLPGIIDAISGHILICISMGWIGESIPARQFLADALGLPVFVANRSRIAALGELRAGVGQGRKSLMYMFLGKGVAAGIAFEDGIYYGASSSAGEIGHSTVVPDGPLCRCGNHGCLELYTSESAILATAIARARETSDGCLREATRGNLQALSIPTLIECAKAADPAACATFDAAGTYLGIALAGALNMLNPEVLVIGGPVGCAAGDLLLAPTIREMQRRTLPLTLSAARIVSGSPEDQYAALGAAAMVLDAVSVSQIFSWDSGR